MNEKKLKEAIANALPYNTNCPQKKAKVDWKREKLFTQIMEIYANRNNTTQG